MMINNYYNVKCTTVHYGTQQWYSMIVQIEGSICSSLLHLWIS